MNYLGCMVNSIHFIQLFPELCGLSGAEKWLRQRGNRLFIASPPLGMTHRQPLALDRLPSKVAVIEARRANFVSAEAALSAASCAAHGSHGVCMPPAAYMTDL
jgi:hypothetical protein